MITDHTYIYFNGYQNKIKRPFRILFEVKHENKRMFFVFSSDVSEFDFLLQIWRKYHFITKIKIKEVKYGFN